MLLFENYFSEVHPVVFCHILLNLNNILSSIILSILTPLAGVGVLPLDRAFSLTLGAQIGTTITGLLAALANMGEVQKIISSVKFLKLLSAYFFCRNFSNLIHWEFFPKSTSNRFGPFFLQCFWNFYLGHFSFYESGSNKNIGFYWRTSREIPMGWHHLCYRQDSKTSLLYSKFVDIFFEC